MFLIGLIIVIFIIKRGYDIFLELINTLLDAVIDPMEDIFAFHGFLKVNIMIQQILLLCFRIMRCATLIYSTALDKYIYLII